MRWSTSIVLISFFFASAANAQLRNRADATEQITSSGQPTAEALEGLADEGFTMVIDLRRPTEDRGIDEQAVVEELGMTYVSIPVDGADGVTFENADVLNQFLEGSEGRVLVHCGSGNRAGALLALGESLNGAEDEAAIEFGKSANLTGLEPVVRERLEAGEDP